MAVNKAHILNNLNPIERSALTSVSESLIAIRVIIRRAQGNGGLSVKDIQNIESLADACHNIPSVIANNESEQLKFLLESGTREAKMILAQGAVF
ncbi:hypothetical protein UN96_17250 [Acinetobacter baumannii]|nr:hypothetical protein A1S_3528 [Acinetobacter baumannii ATCC 17978]KKZ28000.1 hypothetical protein UN96_17250 [Acinetobacter baumannii]KKZ48564.1 hypothetical protein UO00_01735 [Acinetobacter baumannii]UZG64516.2 hypothetical protein OMP06_20640 [Acinetobacter baumannii]